MPPADWVVEWTDGGRTVRTGWATEAAARLAFTCRLALVPDGERVRLRKPGGKLVESRVWRARVRCDKCRR